MGELDGLMVAHAAVVPRVLRIGSRSLAAGYVEGVAADPRHQQRGLATAVMSSVGSTIRRDYEIGALSTGEPQFYQRLGWESWLGPTFADSPGGVIRTEEEDDGVMVLRCEGPEGLALGSPIVCDWREGDVW